MKNTILDIIMWLSDNKSDILAILSLVLGAIAIVQSWKYNKSSGKIAKDMSFMLVQQVRLLNQLEKNVTSKNNKQVFLNLSKDEIELHKLCGFKKCDIPSIMEYINQLNIKERFKQKIEGFLKSTDVNYKCDFWGKAKSDGDINIVELYEILLKYNVIMIIDYH